MPRHGREQRKKVRLASSDGWANSFQGEGAERLPEQARVADISESGVRLVFDWPAGEEPPLQPGDRVGLRIHIKETGWVLEVWSTVRHVAAEEDENRASVGLEFSALDASLRTALQRGMLNLAVIKLRPQGSEAVGPEPVAAAPSAPAAAPAARPKAPLRGRQAPFEPAETPPPAAAEEARPTGRRKRYLGEILVGQGKLDASRLEKFLAHEFTGTSPIGRELRERGLVDDVAVAKALAEQSRVPYMDLASPPPDPGLAATLSKEAFIKHRAIPVAREGRVLLVAMGAPPTLPVLDEIQEAAQDRIRLGIAPERRITEWLWRLYHHRAEGGGLLFAARLEAVYRFFKRDGHTQIGEGYCFGETRQVGRDELVVAGPLPPEVTPGRISPDTLRVEVLVTCHEPACQVLIDCVPLSVETGEKKGEHLVTCRIENFPERGEGMWDRICMLSGTHRFRGRSGGDH